jgi:hypothetical protein
MLDESIAPTTPKSIKAQQFHIKQPAIKAAEKAPVLGVGPGDPLGGE